MTLWNPVENIADHALSYGDASAFPALGFNPTPGNAGVVTSLSQNFLTVTGDLGDARDAMMKAGQTGSFWEGDAAEAFHNDIGQLPDYLDKATRSLGDAGRALAGWCTDLSSMQRTAADYERQAEAAKQKLQQAQDDPDLGLAGQHFDNAADLQAAQQRLDSATANLNAAQSDLKAIQDLAKRLFAQHQDLAKQVEDALNHAKDEAPHKPGLFSRLASACGHLLHDVGDFAKKTWDFVKQHANVIKSIGDALSIVGTVLSVAAAATAAIPIVGEVVEGVSIGVNSAALGAHLLAKAAGAKVSNATLAMDALGMIPGGGAVSGLKVAGNVTRIAKSTVKAVQFAEDGAKVAKGLDAAGTVMERLGARQVGQWAHWGQTIASKVPGLGGAAEKIGVDAVTIGDKTVHVASNAAGHVVGAVTGVTVKTASHIGISAAEDAGKDVYNSVTQGKPLPTAGQVWHQVVAGVTG